MDKVDGMAISRRRCWDALLGGGEALRNHSAAVNTSGARRMPEFPNWLKLLDSPQYAVNAIAFYLVFVNMS